MKVTLQRLGRNLRLVLMLEWLTLWPTWGPLAVSSQRRDILENPLVARISQPWKARRGLKSRSFQEPRTYRQCASTRQELGAFRPAGAAARQKADFAAGPTI